MAAGGRLKGLLSRRRRVGEEGEDEEGPIIVDDSQSEGSILSDADDDDEEDASSFGQGGAVAGAEAAGEGAPEAAAMNGAKASKKARKPRKKNKKGKDQASEPSVEATQPQSNFKAMADTEAMMNGLRIDADAEAQVAVEFETMDQAPAVEVIPNGKATAETPAQRQRREHEDYRRKRDADPAFIPNRGNFFMHDSRGHLNGQPPQPMRGAFAGRGRGRGGAVGGPFSPANQFAQNERAAEQPWKHDLHDTINEEPAPSATAKPTDSPQQQTHHDSLRLFQKPKAVVSQQQPRIVNFSSTTLVGKVQIRLYLPGMKASISFAEVPWNQYIRLPNHRPPLRRDKPVRVSLPERPPHYIFPAPDRSFIFIPRQQRPNQQGPHHSSYQRSVGGYGYSSRRTSMYGGSVYASSVAASRRSSVAGISRADAFSPTSFASGMPPPNRPVIRLPHGGQSYSAVHTPSGPLSGQHTPIGMPQIHTYPLPQQPTFQGTPTSTVHQPRPQKAISVNDIESPALLGQVPSNEQQPFQNQLPPHMAELPGSYGQQAPQYYSPRQQYAYPPQQTGTPLSGIPEQAVHASAYQPQMPYGQSPYHPPYPPPQQQGYYYPPANQNGYGGMPMYMPPPQGYPMMPPPQPMQELPPQQYPPSQQPPPPQPAMGGEQDQPQPPMDQGQQAAAIGQSNMVAHESNGMVFYISRSDIPQDQDAGTQPQYQPAESFVPSYAMPGLPPPTPAPESTAYYYPSHPQMAGMPGMYYQQQG
ncbi:hypothetical protein BAUCODRAFT_290551 [Baudoinia panamericana UAMH 10762]|uniref:Btz domain-containing protein n=1 Tax=Baudoinia panamericana (strain UAMH 10762) TaxID=717646 RepID=M2N0M5_BAUPA|nr:uncharacterized protein BAUCODRAFT_290551 [Baudoinia panamericana UAMH 10762]EMC92469.1 hypothetical protein BAUCODRAFT_290551 [Baudoinia panamericana UAMH 10762]